jgi:cell division protein FtsI/penicillin-binding protein 2
MYQNVEMGANPSATFAWDFENSCNTGFVSLAGKLTPTSVPTMADQVFGFGQTWNVGVGAFDGKVPGGTGDEMTSEMIGQGQVQMSPLNMASVAATARTGWFHQPVIVDPSLIGGPLARTGRGLSAGVDASLRSLMLLTAQQGTVAQAMSGLTGTVGAKTGSAETGTVQPNGWFLAYRDDMAASGVVLQGGHGGDSAGPIVAKVLAAAEG